MLHAQGLEELQLKGWDSECNNTLANACQKYATHCKDERRVRLKTLRLGKHMHMPTVAVLNKAFDLSALESISTSECHHVSAFVIEPDVFEVCDPTVTPNLRNITIGNLSSRNWRHISKVTEGQSFFQAACTDLLWENAHRGNVYALAKINRAPQLRLPHPRRLFDRDHGTLLKSVCNCDWLTHLALCLILDHHRPQLSYQLRPTLRQLEASLPALCEVLATLSRLRILQVYLQFSIQDFEAVHRWHLLEMVKEMAKTCPTLQYIKFADATFVATWPTSSAESTEELEPVVREMNMLTESKEAAQFFGVGLELYV